MRETIEMKELEQYDMMSPIEDVDSSVKIRSLVSPSSTNFQVNNNTIATHRGDDAEGHFVFEYPP